MADASHLGVSSASPDECPILILKNPARHIKPLGVRFCVVHIITDLLRIYEYKCI